MDGSKATRGLFVDCSRVVRGLFVGCLRAVHRLVLELSEIVCKVFHPCTGNSEAIPKPFVGYSWVFGDCSADFMGLGQTLGPDEAKPLE